MGTAGRRKDQKYLHMHTHNPEARESNERKLFNIQGVTLKWFQGCITKIKDNLKSYIHPEFKLTPKMAMHEGAAGLGRIGRSTMGRAFGVSCLVQWLALLATLLLVLVSSADSHMYDVQRLENGTAYLITNNGRVAKRISDDKTVEALGFSPDSLVTLPLASLAALKIGAEVPLIQPVTPGATPDDNMNSQVLISTAVNGDLMKGSTWFGQYMNPAVFSYKGKLLMATGLMKNPTGPAQKPANRKMEFAWMDHAKFPLPEMKEVNGEFLCLNATDVGPMHESDTIGQDPRVVYVDEPGGGRVQVYISNPNNYPSRLGMFEFAVSESSGCLEMTRSYGKIHPLGEFARQPQKNWTPFRYRNETLLVVSINPMVVVKLKPSSEEGSREMQAYKESQAPPVHMDWEFGYLRGGTNAIFLPEKGVYLSFHHSVGHLGGLGMKTYFTGAYTFSAEPPFRLLQVSPVPVMPQRFYEGAWLVPTDITYCMFPLHIFQHGAEIIMSLGGQDKDGYLAWFDLEEVLDSLVDVKPKGAYAHGAA